MQTDEEVPNNSYIIIDVFSEYEISGRPIDNVYVKSSWSKLRVFYRPELRK
jgi:hypothetical protein